MTKERFDIHQHITDKIVNAIERGAGDFRLPWHRSAGSIMRFAGASKLMRFCACLPQESSMRGAHWIAGRGR